MTEAHLSERSGAKERVSMKAEVFLPDDYRPAEDEPFMNDRQLEYFRRKLLVWKQELLDQSAETIDSLQESARNVPDIADRASEETDRALELRTRDRQRKLVSKIDAALRRIENGEFGYCEVTGEPISLRRLDARPDCHDDAGSAGKARTPRESASRRLTLARRFRAMSAPGQWSGVAHVPGAAMSLIGQSVTVVGAGVCGS